MALTVDFGVCGDDPRVVNKTYTSAASVSAEVWGDCSRENPTLLLDYNASVLTANYAHINDFNRYYYVKDVVITEGHKMKVSLAVDALKSFEQTILGTKFFIRRSEAKGNWSIPDELCPVFAGYKPDPISWGDDLYSIVPNTSTCVVLEIIGSGAPEEPEP